MISISKANIRANINTNRKLPSSQNHKAKATSDVTFGKTSHLFGTSLSALCGLALYIGNGGLNFAANENQISKNIGWDKNIRVMASQGQNLKGMSDVFLGNHSYSKNLTDLLENHKIKTIEQANDSLAQNGYVVGFKKFKPLETPGTKLGIFNKDDKNKKRFVLIASQYDGIKYEMIADDFSQKIKKIYNIPEKNMLKIVTNSADEFKTALDKIIKKMNKAKDKKNVELLIYFTGDGDVSAKTKEAKKSEGAMDGSILNEFDKDLNIKTKSLKETELKQILNEKINPKSKVIMLIDACHTGAFITENTTKKALKILA